MLKQLLATGRNHLLNIPGKSLSRKIIVFESDDWGSIRMPSNEVYQKLISKGISLDKNPYNQYDSLESAEDLDALYTVLRKFSDVNGNHPIITANFIMANPDFEKIGASDFKSYYFEPFQNTYKRAKHTEDSWELIRQGQSDKLMRAQFHGREHLNVNQWLNLLRQGHPAVIEAFRHHVFCLDVADPSLIRSNLMAAFDYSNSEELQFVEQSIVEGLKMFEEVFGYSSSSMIAPCNVWGNHVEDIAANQDVKFIQSLRGRCIPEPGSANYQRDFPITGQKNKNGQHYLVRNVYFEPATTSGYDWIKNTMNKIEASFYWKKPALVSTHRLNFIGSISLQNRTQNLGLFSDLISQILKRWPEAEFVSSDQLGEIYEQLEKDANGLNNG